LQAATGGVNAILPGTERTREIGTVGGPGAVTKAHVEKAKEFNKALKILRSANGAGTTANTQINSVTGGGVNAVENWQYGGTYSDEQALRVLARIFARG